MEMSSGIGLNGFSKLKVKLGKTNIQGEKEEWPEKGRRGPKGDPCHRSQERSISRSKECFLLLYISLYITYKESPEKYSLTTEAPDDLHQSGLPQVDR